MPKVKAFNLGVQEKQWQAEDDLRMFLQWKQIMKDPARYKAVQKLAKERKAELDAIMKSATPDNDEDD